MGRVPTLALVEKFYSIQGEGRNAGRAALFIRLAGCNLDCHFADGSVCDTPWRKATEKLTTGQLRTWAMGHLDRLGLPGNGTRRPMVILTGGEPTMSPMFEQLVWSLKRDGWYIAVESNGTIWKDCLRDVDWLVVSPKDYGGVTHPRMLETTGPAVDPACHKYADEWRYVVTGPENPIPPVRAHTFVSPAIQSDGSGTMHLGGFPGFAPGALDRAIAIVQTEPRIRLSLQTHKFMGIR